MIRIIGEGKSYYGGNQSWYARKTQNQGGCGCVCGTNAILVLADRNREKFKMLLEKYKVNNSEIGIKEYKEAMDEMYKLMGTWEVPVLSGYYDKKGSFGPFKNLKATYGRGLTGYIIGVKRFAMRYNVRLNAHVYSTMLCDGRGALMFIKRGLKRAGSVALLTAKNEHSLNVYDGEKEKGDSRKIKSHFMLITGIFEKDRKIYVKVSTWGEMGDIEFDALRESWKKITSYGSALCYITV